jgi:hypothetical protein
LNSKLAVKASKFAKTENVLGLIGLIAAVTNSIKCFFADYAA